MPSKAVEAIKRIQHELARRGFDPGNIDGIWGARTRGAAMRFQAAHGLLADGIVGPRTSRELFGAELAHDPQSSPAVPWFQEARRLIGVREGPGTDVDNQAILDWATSAGISYKSDDIPWCGLFVAHCISSTLSQEPLPANPLGAREWLRFGAPCTPKVGAVLVFWRVQPTGWKGHVGLYAGQDSAAFHVLGGNQSNSVSIARIKFDRLLGARWPASVPEAEAGPVVIADGRSTFSDNEA